MLSLRAETEVEMDMWLEAFAAIRTQWENQLQERRRRKEEEAKKEKEAQKKKKSVTSGGGGSECSIPNFGRFFLTTLMIDFSFCYGSVLLASLRRSWCWWW